MEWKQMAVPSDLIKDVADIGFKREEFVKNVVKLKNIIWNFVGDNLRYLDITDGSV